ncbi:VCBS repeat-containing protein [Spirosoma sp. BT702]|uniref:VCBS repeat-containing protein n=1 Tax=Spirosoma profusum TaxID=2771354 RepID=A0A926XUL7_9BACT|nr:FG-GAP-like repeat-containing protein [Spirosoma profusum]MBD2700718.1 VCBS repeat-containing protein [Spirosoma profusum]
MNERSAPVIADIDGNGRLDLFVSRTEGPISNGTILRYQQTATNSTSFTQVTNTFNSIDVGNYAMPTFTDLDGNGRLDLLIGEEDGNINHWQQVSSNNTSFTLVTANFNSIDVGTNSTPTVTDLDGNGLLDLLVGQSIGTISHFQQSTANSTSFTLVNASFNSIDVGSNSAPTVVDIDGDGRLDLLIGSLGGNIHHYQQTAPNSTSFTPVSTTIVASGSGYTTPTFADLDDNGRLDLLVGTEDGEVRYFQQGSANLTSFCTPASSTSAQSVQIWSSKCLTTNVTVTAPAGFEVSLSATSGFGTSIDLVPINGTIANTNVYTRFVPTSTGTTTGNLQVFSSGATTRTIGLTGQSVSVSLSALSGTACSGSSFTLTANASGYGPNNGTLFTFNGPGLSQSGGASSATATQTGTYSVTANKSGFCASTATTSLTATNIVDLFTLKNGQWSDATVWSCSRVPLTTDRVRIKHTVTIPTSYVAYAYKVNFDNPAPGPGGGGNAASKVTYQSGGQLRISSQ